MDETSGADGIYQLPGAIYNRGHNFTGIGFGLFGLERRQLYMVVAAVWLFQIILSIICLKYFHFGPFEWAWRSLTYWKRQPLLKTKTDIISKNATGCNDA